MEKQPLVSIIINNYNYGQFLSEAIDSALQQNYSPIEVIVVDDGSTDNSREIIATYENRLVPILKENEGQASAFNVGFAASKGEIICFLDADDVFLREKVTKIVEIFTSDCDIGWCFHLLTLIDFKTKTMLGKTRIFPDWNPVRVADKYDFRKKMKRGKLPIYLPPTSGFCAKRSVLEQILPMPITFIKVAADLYVRCAATWLSQGYVLTETLTYQGIHDRNAGTNVKNRGQQHQRGIVIAYLLRINFPGIEQFANKMFARALSNHWQNPTQIPEFQTFVKNYFALTSLQEKLDIYLRTIYRSLPFKKVYTHQLLEANGASTFSKNDNFNFKTDRDKQVKIKK